jgi:hypothetical protein
MAHFAELNQNNIVTRIIVVHNNELLIDGVENEQKGIEFCLTLFPGNWIQTSYNCNFRKNYAAIGDTYDSQLDAFISPEPEGNLGLDEKTCQWIMPVVDLNGD